MRFKVWGICAGICLALAGVARADDGIAAAREHYQKGTTLYDLGRYREAAQEYEAAYQVKSDPALLYNIGQAYRGAGDYPSALRSYRSYLRRAPDATNRAEVESRIVELEQLIEAQKHAKASPPAGTLAPPEQPPGAARSTPGTRQAQVGHPGEPSLASGEKQVSSVNLSAKASTRTPVYKKWWLWTAVGVVLAGGVAAALAVAYTTPNNAPVPAGSYTAVFP